MKNLLYLTLLSAGLSLGGCATARFTPLADPATTNVYFSTMPDRPYREIGFVEYEGTIFSHREQLLKRLVERKAMVHGDAIIQVRFDYEFWWPRASGIIIKYL